MQDDKKENTLDPEAFDGADSGGAENGAAGKSLQGNADNENGGGLPDAPDNSGGDSGRPAEEVITADPHNMPVTDWAKVQLNFDGWEPDAGALESFGGQAVALGLTPKQCQALCDWQIDQIAKARSDLTDRSVAELSKEWGANAGANQQKCISLISRIDSAAGNNDFSKAINESGAACHAGFVRGLLKLAESLAEDTVSGQGNGAGGKAAETALEGLKEAFARARAGR